MTKISRKMVYLVGDMHFKLRPWDEWSGAHEDVIVGLCKRRRFTTVYEYDYTASMLTFSSRKVVIR